MHDTCLICRMAGALERLTQTGDFPMLDGAGKEGLFLLPADDEPSSYWYFCDFASGGCGSVYHAPYRFTGDWPFEAPDYAPEPVG